MRYIDLHVHSSFSDGALSPSRLALYAKDCGLSAVALTDHDTIDGLEEFFKAAQSVGLEGIPGLELSSELDGAKIHLLGYFFERTDSELCKNLALLRQKRNERNERITKALIRAGAEVDLDEVKGLGRQSISRVHFAKALCRHGYCSSIPEAFAKYLDYGAPAYVPRETLAPENAIALIKQAKGQVYLAHLNQISLKKGSLDGLTAKLKDIGLDGIEAYYGEYDRDMTRYCLTLADRLKLKVSAGSDFHGVNKKNLLGVDGEGRKFSYEILKAMRAEKA